VYAEDAPKKSFKKQFKLKKNEESPFDFVKNNFLRKEKLRNVYSKRNDSLLGKRANFWNYDDNNLGNDLLREIMHYTKNFAKNEENLQFRTTAEYLKSIFLYFL
jgi:hypothetical protein